jgi:long-chain acyl-CoA synthetase
MDEDGYFYIVDRKKGLIISSGYNIYPRDIEEVFYQHPAVNKVAVIGIPDKKRGENVKAFVTLKEGQNTSVDELMKFCQERLAKYKCRLRSRYETRFPNRTSARYLKRNSAPK